MYSQTSVFERFLGDLQKKIKNKKVITSLIERFSTPQVPNFSSQPGVVESQHFPQQSSHLYLVNAVLGQLLNSQCGPQLASMTAIRPAGQNNCPGLL